MVQEVRRVPPDWQHPRDEEGKFIPLYDGMDYESDLSEWDEGSVAWSRGEFPDYTQEENKKLTYAEYAGHRPDAKDYMPRWTEAEATHFMLYGQATKATPISPVFRTVKELDRWREVDGRLTALSNKRRPAGEWSSYADVVLWADVRLAFDPTLTSSIK